MGFGLIDPCWEVRAGDCLEVMRGMADSSVDAVVTDPPYGLAFMGKKWDYDVPSVEVWAECLRVLKPGGHLLSFAGTRTQHRMAVRIEDAGFEIRDMIAWVYGSGFPKSLDVSKAIDAAAGVETTDDDRWVPTPHPVTGAHKTASGNSQQVGQATPGLRCLYAPATEDAKRWSGWGTALKPAMEPITVARRPLIGTVAANVLAHGTGGLNVDGCRVEGQPRTTHADGSRTTGRSGYEGGWKATECNVPSGRWPANLIHDGGDAVMALMPETESEKMMPTRTTAATEGRNAYGADAAGGFTTMETYGDAGSAARFFYCAKASQYDRDAGVAGVAGVGALRDGGRASRPRKNNHPTVKPTDLMRYLCRLVTPPGGLVLDPFAGSGSTGRGAVLESFRFVGIEREPEYADIARARIAHAAEERGGRLF